jgi:predicted nucleic acid-binding protein
VPTAVYNEIAVLGKGKQGHESLDTASYIHVKVIQNILAASLLRSQLDYGEAEAIVLARELGADILILDEKKALKVAQANSQPVIGTIGILQAAKNKGLISDMKTQLDGLIANGIWIDRRLYQATLQGNGERGTGSK